MPKFERPPFSAEVFNSEFYNKFDKLPGEYRHFLKQVVKTGSITLATQQAKLKEIDIKAEDNISKLLSDNGLGLERIMVHLHECLKAEMLVKDKHGKVHVGVNLPIKLKTAELLIKLHMSGKVDTKAPPVDLFESIEE